jgi:hypothetical protein
MDFSILLPSVVIQVATIMAHFCYAASTDALAWLTLSLPDVAQIGIWGGGPAGEILEIVVSDARIGKVEFPSDLQSFPVQNLRVFEVTALGAGTTTIEARIPGGATYAAPLRLTVTAGGGGAQSMPSFFYHGATLDSAKNLMVADLAPMAVAEMDLLGVDEYTDFGKGLYTHPEESKQKAVEWAKRAAKKESTDWGVVRFALTDTEIGSISGQRLHFPDKFKTRPSNAPKLFGGKPALWIEFVEYNRHIRTPSIQRPKDNDWTADYAAWMRGPIWGGKDSNLPVPHLPEFYHQINWGLKGLEALNASVAKKRRFLFTKRNEGSI